ncbi:YaaR family protein [Brevibacillus fluminis]|uniref:YaaR family protein n=1 Tax=Brevibacillus fluminis TaxID=511487 RepID=UPI003F89FDD8
MDVNKIGMMGLDKLRPKQEKPLESISFQELMAKGREKINQEKFQRLLQDIDEQGKILAESRTVEDLRRYKQLVKELMNDVVKYGISLEERRGFNRRGRTKIYKILSEVDKKLLQVTDEVLKKESRGLSILDLVGEIKGLLINIFA